MIHTDLQDGVAVLRMDHGKVSALDSELLDAIRSELTSILNSDAGAVILTGSGRAFSAGVDLIRLLEAGEEYTDGFVERLSATCYDLFTCPKPVVAAVNGHAIAGGCILACACDYRIMVEGAGKIGVTELLVGVPFPSIALEILQSVAHEHAVRRLVARGETIAASEAYGYGLVDEAVEPGELMPRAFHIAGELAAIPARAYALTKQQMKGPYVKRHRALREHDTEVAKVWKTPETHDKIRAYLKKVLGK